MHISFASSDIVAALSLTPTRQQGDQNTSSLVWVGCVMKAGRKGLTSLADLLNSLLLQGKGGGGGGCPHGQPYMAPPLPWAFLLILIWTCSEYKTAHPET